MRGEGGGVAGSQPANEYSCAYRVHINFGDLTPFLTYARLYSETTLYCTLKVVDNEKGGGPGGWTVRRCFRTMAIDVCLLFNVAVVFSSTYFRFLFVKHS
jgi:hypothetical protein